MDTELLRTFLEVNRTRHFGKAAANLYLTQSAVSARIRLLEQTVGVPLFSRTRNDIQLTPQGRKLLQHAETVVTAWNRARQDIALDVEDKSSLVVAGVPDLWDIMLPAWVEVLCANMPDMVLTAEAFSVETIAQRLRENTIDLGLILDSLQVAEFVVDEFANIRFLMVSSEADKSSEEAVGAGYLLVNWGTWFTTAHARHFPELPTPRVRVGLGRIARILLLGGGGSAYLAEPMVAADLRAGRLHLVNDAPVIERPAFAVYSRDAENRSAIEKAIGFLKTDLSDRKANHSKADGHSP